MDPKYDLGEFHQTYKELVKEDPQEKLLQRHFIQSEDKGREDFRRKITNLTKYYHDLNTEYNFSALPRMKLFQKLKDNKQKSNDEKQKKKHYYLISEKNPIFI